MRILIKNGRIIDPANNIDFVGDLLAVDGVVAEISKSVLCDADEVIDASGCVVAPGFVDLHVHLRDPGFLHKETILTGQKAAARGGFTTICAMPNTSPVTDSPEIVRYIIDKSKKADIITPLTKPCAKIVAEFCSTARKYRRCALAVREEVLTQPVGQNCRQDCARFSERSNNDAAGAVNVLPVGSITLGQNGAELSQIREMVKEGICAISEDGKTVADANLLKEAMNIAKELEIPVFSHCEDIELVKGGVINEGIKSAEYNLPGISNQSEDIIIERDIALARETGVKLHLCHVSTKGGVELIRNAKARSENVTAEVCPHHFVLSDSDIKENDGKYKMNPPLRSWDDVNALIKGLADNTIEVIATDHAPHHETEKAGGFEKSAFGIAGLETAFALSYTYLCKPGHLTLPELIKKLTVNPANVLGIPRGTLSAGAAFDAVILKTDEEFIIDVKKFESLGKNSPFDSYKLFGAVKRVFVSKL